MSATVPAILVVAGGVGLAHSVLPDHWLPLAMVARARRDPLRRVARLSLWAGATHVLVSLVLGAVVLLIGLSLRSAVQAATDAIVGGVLILTGVGLLIAQATGRHHAHDHHDHAETEHRHGDHGPDHDAHDHDDHDHAAAGPAPGSRRGLGVLIPFGAAASPDLTILPVFLAASALGVGAAVGSLLVFAVVTIGTFVGLTTLSAAGSYRLRAEWLDRHGNLLTAAVLIVIGGLIAAHLL